MKNLWDDEKKERLYPTYSQYITVEQFNDLVDRLNAEITSRIESDDVLKSNFELFISSIAIEVTTALLKATKIEITDADISKIIASTIDVTELKADSLSSDYAVLVRAIITGLEATEIEAVTVKSNEITADKATVEEAAITSLDSETVTVKNIVAENIDCQSIHYDSVDIKSITAEDLTVENETALNAAIESLTAGIIYNDQITSGGITTNTIKHEINPIEVANIQGADYWVEIPYFTNGSFRVVAKDYDNNQIWAVNVHNQIAHPWFEWSYMETLPIQTKFIPEVVVRDRDERPVCFIHIQGVNGPHRLYITADTLNVNPSITIYDTFDLIIERDKAYKTTENAGIYFTGEIIMEKDAAEVEPLVLKTSKLMEEVTVDTSAYDGTLRVERTEYRPDQEVNTDSDVVHNNLTLTDLDTGKYVKTDDDDKLISVDEAVVTDGKLTTFKDEVVSSEVLDKWNGKSTLGNAITKLSTVDEGSIDTKNTDYIKQPHFYVGPTLDSLDSVALDTVLIERDL